VAEVPLLLETGWPSDFDLIVGLVCDPDRRRNWLLNQPGMGCEPAGGCGVLAMARSQKKSGPATSS
jgi:hypothetical protein